jgi:hypothetical protein
MALPSILEIVFLGEKRLNWGTDHYVTCVVGEVSWNKQGSIIQRNRNLSRRTRFEGFSSCLVKFDVLGCVQKFPDWVDNEINNNKHSLRSNTKGYGGKTH